MCLKKKNSHSASCFVCLYSFILTLRYQNSLRINIITPKSKANDFRAADTESYALGVHRDIQKRLF